MTNSQPACHYVGKTGNRLGPNGYTLPGFSTRSADYFERLHSFLRIVLFALAVYSEQGY